MISIALLIFAFSAKAQNQFLTTVNNFGPGSVNVQIHWIDAAACTLYASSQVVQLGPAPDYFDYVTQSALTSIEPYVTVSNPGCPTTDYTEVGMQSCPAYNYPSAGFFNFSCPNVCFPPQNQLQVQISPAGIWEWEVAIN